MNKTIVVALLLMILIVKTAAQENATATVRPVPQNFKSDGCSLFPDGDYRHCCIAHDLTYFAGGSRSERLTADNKLYKCVASQKGWWHKLVAPVMWAGVRIGGVSFLPTPFRWGFGRTKKSVRPKQKSDLSKVVKLQQNQ